MALVLTALVLLGCGGANEEDVAPTLDAAGFQRGYDQLTTTIDRATAGDVDGAEEAFAQVSPTTRLASEALADLPEEIIDRAKLIDAVTRIEQELANARRPDVLAGFAEDAREALAVAAEALGVERPQER